MAATGSTSSTGPSAEARRRAARSRRSRTSRRSIAPSHRDGDFNDSGMPLPFFGRTAYFPRGPVELALISRAPILPMFIVRGQDRRGPGSGGFKIVVFDPIEPVGDPRDGAAVEAILKRIVA